MSSSSEAQNLDIILSEAENQISAVSALKDLEDLRIKYLGKSGIVTSQLKTIASLPVEEKKDFGAKVNVIKNKVASLISSKKEILDQAALDEALRTEKIDVTLPAKQRQKGSIHPISQTIEEITEIFGVMGFQVAEGPEIEDDYTNFTALNIPENHPARQMHDTFYVKAPEGDEKTYVLRTHTSPVQVRTMQEGTLPIKVIAPGRTFRCDSDQTHSPMFHQVEGLYVAEQADMGMLKGCLQEFLESFFGVDNIKMRFRTSFFPFTEPSAEVDISCNKKNGQITIGDGDDWLEILGCGMVHPNVLKNAGIDSTKYSGFAFGMGVERLAMLKYGMSDLRDFFGSDARWLKHYGFNSFDIPKLISGW